jgi:UDP-glucose 4-epimerase
VKKVLITGGAGFIGSHLADRLLARGDEVLVIDNFATARHDNLRPREGLELVEGTIVDRRLVDETWERFAPDVVAHAAASYKDPDDWQEDAATNAAGTANVVRASEAAGVERLVYFQTALCYGLQPLEQPITLDHPLRPEESSYAISKTAGEYYVRLSGLDWVSLRLANAYGPRNVSGPLPTFFHRLTNDKPCFVMDTRRDFIYVDDLIDLVEMAVDGRGEQGVYHASSGADYSIEELFNATVSALGVDLDEEVEVRERNPDDAFTILLDPGRTREEFNWRPKTSLQDGVAAAVEYYREFGIEETYTHLKMAEEKQPAQ